MITVDLRSRTAIYEQIKTQIIELIMAGVLKPNDQLQSIRNLARELKLNVNTVKKAFSDLEEEGIIYSLPGRGSFVAEDALGNSKISEKALDEIREAVKTGKSRGVASSDILKIVREIYGE